MSITGTAVIRKDEFAQNYSKYVVEATVKDNGFDIVWFYNINADVVVPQFSGTGLKVAFNDYENLTGTQRFSGIIGTNRIRIQTTKGVVIEGIITGGPSSAQTFIGAGTWTRA